METTFARTGAEREAAVQKRLGECRHFNGLYGPGMTKHETCGAGVRYDDLRKADGRALTGLPCLAKYAAGAPPCALRSPWTREEAEAQVAAMDAAISRTLSGMVAVRAASDAVRSGAGVVACPTCGGRLHWSKAGVNGHVHGRCETPECTGWME